MENRRVKGFYSVINYLFLLFISVTLFDALRSDNLKVSQLSNHFFMGLLLVFLVLGVIASSKRVRELAMMVIKTISQFVREHLVIVTSIFFVLGIFIQILLLVNISAPIGWDVDGIFEGVNRLPKDKEYISTYLSKNPNNSFYFFFMYGMTKIMNLFNADWGNSWLAWQLLNTFFMDLGLILLFQAGKNLFNQKTAYVAFYLGALALMFSPWILVPYTDIIMIPVISSILIFYAKLNTEAKSNSLVAIVLGVFIGISYLLKPSSIVYFIAWIMVMGAKQVLTLKKIKFKKFIFFLIVSFFCLLTIGGFSIFKQQQSLVTYDENQAKPWTHFVMMGLTGSGGFSEEDTQMTNSLPTKKAKSDNAVKTIKQRLKNYGAAGYLKFLFYKQFNNTDRGDFGWGRDGTPQVPATPAKNKLQEILRDSYYQQGGRTNNIRFVMQLLWIVTLIGMLFSFGIRNQNEVLIMMKLTVIGAFLYLLLFEGGRSRYLIQYLPFFYLIAANGWVNRKSENLELVQSEHLDS